MWAWTGSPPSSARTAPAGSDPAGAPSQPELSADHGAAAAASSGPSGRPGTPARSASA